MADSSGQTQILLRKGKGSARELKSCKMYMMNKEKIVSLSLHLTKG